ncbi:MAG TPA: hypothetical protein VFB62_28485, partial [Polyangiaceae bacterium]|nr:hypothetical protein [Polyangiaceae bacterium]
RITLRGSLVEQSHEIGMYVAGSEATVEASVVRSTQPNAQGSGRGVNAQAFSATGPPSTLLVRTSLVEQNHDVGVFVGSSAATVEASVVRDTQPDAQGLFGHGVGAQAFSTTSPPSTLLVRTSLVEQSHTNGVYVAGAEATLEASVVRDTQPNARGRFGRGVTAQAYSTTGPPSALLLRASLVDQNHDTGVFVAGSDANLEASVVRDTQPDAQGLFGRGVTAEAYPMMGPPTTLLVRTSLVERSHDLGVFVAGAQATVEASIVRDIQPDVLELGGRGLHVQAGETGAPSVLFLRSSLVAQSYEAGVAILGSVATIEACLLQGTQPSPGWGGGEAVMVVSKEGAASASITGTRIHESALAAVAAWGAHADVKGSALSCQAFDLDAESYQGTAAELEDLGGNVCGCPEPISRCKAVSAGLEPPPALESVQD